MITLRTLSEHVIEVTRAGVPTAYLLDSATYGEIARTLSEDARWKLVKAHALATRKKQEA